MNERNNIYPAVLRRLEREDSFVLATIVETGGATPQVSGASALFDKGGLVLGTLGGGMLEADAEGKALECLKKRSSLLYQYDLQGEDVASGEPICGGVAWLLVDGSPDKSRKAWRSLVEALLARRSGVLVTRISRRTDGQAGIKRFWLDDKKPDLEAGSALGRFSRELAQVSRQDKPMLLREQGKAPEKSQTFHFLEPITPLPRLLIVGAGHIGQAVARQAGWLGFEVTVIDDRPEYASPERFGEGTALIVSDIERAVREFPVSPDTYVVIVTRGHSHDAEALSACIHSSAAYIGMIGSRRKIVLLRERFLSAGWASAGEWERIHAPIGLPIGSKTVDEIAVSIAAELVQVRSRVRERRARESE